LDAADRWLLDHDPTYRPAKEARDIPYGAMLDNDGFAGSSGDDAGPSDRECLSYLVNAIDPVYELPRSVFDKAYADAHKDEKRAYNREYRKQAKANPTRIPGRTWYAGQWCTPEQVEQRRAETLRHYHANREAINRAKRAKRRASTSSTSVARRRGRRTNETEGSP
jgi:hypothetical protein